jgi:PilZ domain-containing protein
LKTGQKGIVSRQWDAFHESVILAADYMNVETIRRLLGRRNQTTAPAVSAGWEVTVWIRGLGRTAGTVIGTTDRDAEITLAVDPRFGDDAIDEAEGVVEHTAPIGLYRQPGSVRFAGAASDITFVPSQRAERVQRREYVRLPVDLTVSATLPSDETPFELYVIDLSASGMLLGRTADVRVDDGTTLWLSIPIADGEPPIAPRGKVVRGAEEGTHGVRFDYITDDDQERLVRYVLREQLRLRREGKL